MKVLQERAYSGWANFGQNDQYYMTAHSIQIDEKGLVWKVLSSGEKEPVMSPNFYDTDWNNPLQMKEDEAKELFIEGVFNSHEEFLKAYW